MRRKLPAYGRQLLERRRAGDHPLDVSLCFGSLWRFAPPPKVAVMPSEFVPGAFDWSVLAGLCVTVFTQAEIDWQPNVVTNHLGALHSAHFAVLCAELAEADAFVVVDLPIFVEGKGQRRREFLLDMTKRLAGTSATAADRLAWPSWWSDALQKKQEAAAAGYLYDIDRAHGTRK